MQNRGNCKKKGDALKTIFLFDSGYSLVVLGEGGGGGGGGYKRGSDITIFLTNLAFNFFTNIK